MNYSNLKFRGFVPGPLSIWRSEGRFGRAMDANGRHWVYVIEDGVCSPYYDSQVMLDDKWEKVFETMIE